MYIDNDNFVAWMERIMDRLDMQDKKIDRLMNSHNCLNGEKLLDNQDLCLLLQISKRTLQRYRSEGALAYKTLGKKTYYSETDVLDFLSKHVKDFRQNDIEFYKARIRNLFNK